MMIRLASALLLLFFVLYTAVAAASPSNVNAALPGPIVGADFTVQISKGSPDGFLRFNYSENSNSSSQFIVGLKEVWEAADSDYSVQVAGSVVPLSHWGATLGPKDTGNNTQSVFIKYTFPGATHLYLNLSVPLGPADFNDSVAAGMITVDIAGYKWVSPNSTQLVFTWFVEQSMNGKDVANLTLKTKAGKTVDFSTAYFSVNTTADSGNDTIDVSLLLACKYSDETYDTQSVYVVYDRFDSGDLVHDPQFGFGSGPGSNLLWIIIIVVVILAILVIILIAVIGFVLVRRRRKAYDTF